MKIAMSRNSTNSHRKSRQSKSCVRRNAGNSSQCSQSTRYTPLSKLVEKERSRKRFSIGCSSLDDLLSPDSEGPKGVECGAITEFYGPAGSGKTQLCQSLTVQALQSEF